MRTRPLANGESPRIGSAGSRYGSHGADQQMTCRWNEPGAAPVSTLTLSSARRAGGSDAGASAAAEPTGEAVNEHLLTSLLNLTV